MAMCRTITRRSDTCWRKRVSLLPTRRPTSFWRVRREMATGSERSCTVDSTASRSLGSQAAFRSAVWRLIAPGVYVPRWQSEPLARRAVERLPANGVAIDLCTGAGAIAKVLASERPKARVVASDLDERSCACAAANGVEVCRGDLFGPLPRALEGHVDLVVGVVPYVPTRGLGFWPVTPWSSRHLCRTTAVPTEPTSSDESWRTARSSCAKEVRSSSNWAAIRPTLSSPT